jgi:LacI family transcriptional regulator
MLGELLVKQGHKRIAYIGFSPARPDMERTRGLTESLKAHGQKFTRFEVRAPTVPEGERLCPSVVLRRDKFDAVVCYNDMVAIGFLGAARSLGVAVPADISVVGIDNIPFGRFTSPALTTVDTQSEYLGEEGMRLLFRLIAGEKAPGGHMKVEPRLVMRDSTVARG